MHHEEARGRSDSTPDICYRGTGCSTCRCSTAPGTCRRATPPRRSLRSRSDSRAASPTTSSCRSTAWGTCRGGSPRDRCAGSSTDTCCPCTRCSTCRCSTSSGSRRSSSRAAARCTSTGSRTGTAPLEPPTIADKECMSQVSSKKSEKITQNKTHTQHATRTSSQHVIGHWSRLAPAGTVPPTYGASVGQHCGHLPSS